MKNSSLFNENRVGVNAKIKIKETRASKESITIVACDNSLEWSMCEVAVS